MMLLTVGLFLVTELGFVRCADKEPALAAFEVSRERATGGIAVTGLECAQDGSMLLRDFGGPRLAP